VNKKEEIHKIIDEALFIDVDIEQPTPIITIQNKTIGTEGNFITINGLPKSRKTTFMQFFIYSAISGNEYCDIKVNIEKKDKIILIDTEQSIFDFSRQINGLKYLLRANKLPNQFSAYLFRKYEPNVILNSISELVQKEKPKLLFIDNITELCINVNDMTEAKAVIQFLKKIQPKRTFLFC
jgi:KaiC/GvpD/RAD55 family RecA-like ATPase